LSILREISCRLPSDLVFMILVQVSVRRQS
jgi:hypothetical protein